MPLSWSIDRDARCATITVQGALVRQDLDNILAMAVTEGAAGFCVLLRSEDGQRAIESGQPGRRQRGGREPEG